MFSEKVEKYRVRESLHGFGSDPGDDFGLFFIPTKRQHKKDPLNLQLKVIVSPFNSEQWQHVSVSLPNRCPIWSEMCEIKNLFWGEYVTVLQFHPKKSEYVNNCPTCLHMWKKVGIDHELPPSGLV